MEIQTVNVGGTNGAAILPSIPEPEPAQAEMLKRAVCINVELAGIGNRRKVSTSQVEVEADKALIAVSKVLVDSPEYTAIKKLDGEIRQWLYSQCVQSGYKWGVYLVPIKAIERTETKLQEFSAKRTELVRTWTTPDESGYSPYDLEVVKTQERLGVLANSGDYLSNEQLRTRYTMSWQYVSFGVPNQLKVIRRELFEQEEAKAKAKWAEATEEVQQALRAAFADLVEHAIDKLSGNREEKCPDCEKHTLAKPIGDDTPCPTCGGKGTVELAGKPKIFRDSLVGNVKGFLETFSDRNITEDADLEKLVGEAKRIVAGVDPKILRESATTRSYVSTGFAAIKAKLDTMLVDRPSRKISFEEE